MDRAYVDPNAPNGVAASHHRKFAFRMQLCLVTGTVVATRKNARFEGAKLLIVQRLDAEGRPVPGRDELALDPKYGAGVGDVVLVAREGDVVAQVVGPGTPANVVVIGVVDDVDVVPP